ncbi:putative calcium/calmodulin-dependent protein kinase [Leptomonas pyrrhocoris]|uniref:Putative calcium/calmodulin-dependent protein kinase n=1 Tax=Leptomonas pyrrhocoris TaxID=157538 RepID=A0A0N0DUQ1_LEPPY|nr:putative calcium/calmodulin-dependent protein kinase [Leptomonas pyrrhocoris]KPA79262.1 putative calcium/calmodulin-dependent protein kinase [Leptomonas pyrrhocoris]|eukprot:XP_015657701.1 putative calcium/calmodulin-dependent protein kinase [Leptomonas pyrrhocoris]
MGSRVSVDSREASQKATGSPKSQLLPHRRTSNENASKIGHRVSNSVRLTSGGLSKSCTSSADKDADVQQISPSSPLLQQAQAHEQPQQQQQQQQQRSEDEDSEQRRLCEKSPVQSSSLLNVASTLSTSSQLLLCRKQQQQSAEQMTTTTSTTRTPRGQTTLQQPPSPPSLQTGHRRLSDSATTTTTSNSKASQQVKRNPIAVPCVVVTASPTEDAMQMDAAAELDVEYLDDGSNFDIDSTDEDENEEGATAAQHPYIIFHSAAAGCLTEVGVDSAKHSPAGGKPIKLPAGSSTPLPTTLLYSTGDGRTNGGFDDSNAMDSLRRQHTAESTSLVSLAATQDDVFTPTSARSTGNDRLGSVSPILNGFGSVNGSRPPSRCLVGAPRNGCVDQANHHGLATFCNQPRECTHCRSSAVAFGCELCEDFFLCENCRFDLKVVHAIHDPTHAMLSIQDNHCSSSRTFGGDSIFSLSGEGGASSLFNPPCSRCGRVIDDTEPVYRCEQCDYVLCQECFFKPPEPVVADAESPHEHVLKRFQRKSKSSAVHEGAVVNKSRSSGGNRVINDYVVVRLLGQGSYAKVKLVQHIRTQELFALKILKKQKKASSSGMNLGRSRVKLASAGVSDDDLLREIAVMRFIDHPNITKLKEVIEDVEAQKVYVIMEYCEEGPVHVLGTPPLALAQVRQYGADIMRGLLYLHSEFLYHRDIKPANCLVNHDLVAKIADFGTCNSQIRTKSTDGTLAFSCPEQVRGEEVSGEAVDSWAFALTLYEMAYGILPVSTTSLLQHRNALLGAEPISIPDSGDSQLRDLLAAMLNKDLKRRMLLSAAACHPFFAALHIDPHGAPCSSSQLATTKETGAPAQSPTVHDVPSSHGDHQQQQQHGSLTELYDKALESVYRGKNLKDCFHGVRALRRIRRKEAETARHANEAAAAADGNDDDDTAYYFDEDDENGSGVLHSRDTDLDTSLRSPTGYGCGSSSSPSGSVTGEPDYEEAAAAAAAASAVEEIVEHHATTKEPKVEVTYVNLSRQSTLEKLNQLSATVVELRLSHNALAATAGLQLSAFSVLKEVSISFNRLDEFPEDVLLIPRLVRLDVSHNRIPAIPPSLVSRAPFLERLNLHHNCITHVGTVTGPTDAGPASVSAPAAAKVVSVLAAPCLRHVRLSGNPLDSLPLALETTNHLKLVLDAIPALMEQWQAYAQTHPTTATATTDNGTAAPAQSPSLLSNNNTIRGDNAAAKSDAATTTTSPPPTPFKSKLPAVIVWDDSFPVRIPDVEPAVWLAVNNTAVYRVQTLRTCRTRRVVLCQCADARFPNGAFDRADLEKYFAELTKALQEHRRERQLNGSLEASDVGNSMASGPLPSIVSRAARSYVESYFFVTDDETEEDGGYHDLVEYLNDAFAAKEAVLVVVVTNGNKSAVRTNIVAALSTCLTQLRGKDLDDVSEQAELVVSTMRSLYA